MSNFFSGLINNKNEELLKKMKYKNSKSQDKRPHELSALVAVYILYLKEKKPDCRKLKFWKKYLLKDKNNKL